MTSRVLTPDQIVFQEAHQKSRLNFPAMHKNAQEFEAAVRNSKAPDECLVLIMQLFEAMDYWLKRAPHDAVLVLWASSLKAALDGFAAVEANIRKNPRPDLEPVMKAVRETLNAPQAQGTALIRNIPDV